MKYIGKTNNGFTLIEVIVVLLLGSVIAAVIGFGLIRVVQGMVFTKTNNVTIQKGQFAIMKLVKEFNSISTYPGQPVGGSTSLTFSSYKKNIPGSHTVTFSGNVITFDGNIITDQASGFTLNYYDNYGGTPQTAWKTTTKIIEITLKLKGADEIESQFQARVRPRNL